MRNFRAAKTGVEVSVGESVRVMPELQEILRAARRFGGSMRTATVVFVALWCVMAAGDMWVRASQAGHSLLEGLPVLLPMILLPAMVAPLVRWTFLRSRVEPR